MEQTVLTWKEVSAEVDRIAGTWEDHPDIYAVYGIPRGGCIPAALVAERLRLPMQEQWPPINPRHVLVVDDIIDSGRTAARYAAPYSDALVRKPHSPGDLVQAIDPIRTVEGWVVFPWETTTEDTGPEDAVVRLLEHVGEDPTRDGLLDTPSRVLRALTEMTAGYNTDVGTLLTRTFAGTDYGGLVVVSDVDFVSLCEHHLLTFTGTATVGYIPGEHGNVVGLSKLARLVDVYAHRLQIQERMTEQIADALETHLEPEGVGVVLRARHSCLACRGARKANAEMVTSSLRGALYDKPEARAEFMSLAHQP